MHQPTLTHLYSIICGRPGWLVGLLLLLVGPMQVVAQNVEKDSTVWVGEWRDDGNLQYAFTLRLKPLGEGRFSGVFEWKLIWTSLSEHKPKVGAAAKETVVGRYDAANKSFNLVGIKQDDPADIISMDHYLINVSADGKRLEGINVKPENYHGSMFGVIQPPKPKPVIAVKKPASKPTPVISPKPTSKPQPEVVTAPTPVEHATSVSAAKEIESREIVTKTELRAQETQVRIRIFDESLIDGDVVSLSWNGVWVLRYYRVAKLPRELVLDLEHGENTLVMHAENLGKYPPNTAAISITHGAKTNQFILNSDMGKSEAIKILRD